MDKCISDGGDCGIGGHCKECPHTNSDSDVERIVIPDEAKHLIRFLAAAWSGADTWVWENASLLDEMENYPIVQGTSNQIKLQQIGQQEFDGQKIALAVQAMLEV